MFQELWSSGQIECSIYPLEGMDTIDDNGKILTNAGLNFIVNGNSEGHFELLEVGVVKRLLQDKWATYCRVIKSF